MRLHDSTASAVLEPALIGTGAGGEQGAQPRRGVAFSPPPAAAPGPLGIYRRFQAALRDEDIAARDRKRERRLRWARWSWAAELLADTAVSSCRQYASWLRSLQGRGPDIVAGDDGARWAHTMCCKSSHGCPLCAPWLAELERQALERVVDDWRGAGHGFALITFTVPHVFGDGLAPLADQLQRAQASLFGSRAYQALMGRYGIVHHCRNKEITVGPVSGWHPHRHDLAFADVALSDQAAAQLRDELADLWVDEQRRVGLIPPAEALDPDDPTVYHAWLYGVKVQAGYGSIGQYIAKHGHEPKWSLPAEMTKGKAKQGRKDRSGVRFSPFQLLDAMGDDSCPVEHDQLRAWFMEYYAVAKGTHALQWSRGAKEALGYDEALREAREQSEHAPKVLEVTAAECTAVRRAGAHVVVLEACERDGVPAALELLEALVTEHVPAADRCRDVRGRWQYSDLWEVQRAPAKMQKRGVNVLPGKHSRGRPPAVVPDYDDDWVPPMNPLSAGPWPPLPDLAPDADLYAAAAAAGDKVLMDALF